MYHCINQSEDARYIHTDDKFTLNLVTMQNVGNPLAPADKLHWNDSHLQNKSNKRNVRSRCFYTLLGAIHYTVPCNVSGVSLMPVRWPFTKVAKTCGKFALLPPLIPGSSSLILGIFPSLSNFGWENSERIVARKTIQQAHMLIS